MINYLVIRQTLILIPTQNLIQESNIMLLKCITQVKLMLAKVKIKVESHKVMFLIDYIEVV